MTELERQAELVYQVDKVKELLKQEEARHSTTISVIPIRHNRGKVMLLFEGWWIVLESDGTWYWEATDGG